MRRAAPNYRHVLGRRWLDLDRSGDQSHRKPAMFDLWAICSAGNGEGDDESIKVELSTASCEVAFMVFAVISDSAFNCARIQRETVLVVDSGTGRELASYTLTVAPSRLPHQRNMLESAYPQVDLLTPRYVEALVWRCGERGFDPRAAMVRNEAPGSTIGGECRPRGGQVLVPGAGRATGEQLGKQR